MNEPHPSQTAKSSTLFETITSQIEQDGPLSLANYIGLALGDADHGYYHKQDPFGADGDFTTAPEISGLFGEMCGLYLAHMADLSGLGQPAILELGPGRGSLMADMRHVWSQIMPQLAEGPVHLVETSPALRKRQKTGERQPIFIGIKILMIYQPHQFLALPMNFSMPCQLIKRFGATVKMVPPVHGGTGLSGLSMAGLALLMARRLAKPKSKFGIWRHFPHPADGSIAEYCAMADAYAANLATHIASYGGACLIIDYGRDGPSGDSLQAVADHQPVDVFHQPGDADLSHWVDFSALRRAATNCGARLVGPVTQGDFLQAIGISQRTEAVAKLADAETRRGLYAAVDRLVSSQQMGSAFKVAMMLPSGTGLPPGFAAVDDQGSTA